MDIQVEIKKEREVQERLTRRYKNCCNGLYYAQWVLNLISVSCYSTSIATLTTAIGIPITAITSGVGVASNAASIFCNQLNKTKIKKLKRHAELLTLCRNIELEIGMEQDTTAIHKILKRYYQQKDKHFENFLKDITV